MRWFSSGQRRILDRDEVSSSACTRVNRFAHDARDDELADGCRVCECADGGYAEVKSRSDPAGRLIGRNFAARESIIRHAARRDFAAQNCSNESALLHGNGSRRKALTDSSLSEPVELSACDLPLLGCGGWPDPTIEPKLVRPRPGAGQEPLHLVPEEAAARLDVGAHDPRPLRGARDVPDPEDGRGAWVRPTPAGTKLLERNRRRKEAYLAKALARLEPRDVATLEDATRILERLTEVAS